MWRCGLVVVNRMYEGEHNKAAYKYSGTQVSNKDESRRERLFG